MNYYIYNSYRRGDHESSKLFKSELTIQDIFDSINKENKYDIELIDNFVEYSFKGDNWMKRWTYTIEFLKEPPAWENNPLLLFISHKVVNDLDCKCCK